MKRPALLGCTFTYASLGIFILSLLMINSNAAPTPKYRPAVLWHGMGDTCCYPFSMGHLKKLIEEKLPGIYVYSIEIGPDIPADEYNSYFMNVNDQIAYAAKELKALPELAKGFNALGFSQGGQFLRAYVQRYNTPSVYNLVSVGGQHQGVYGFPKCPGANDFFCDKVREMLNIGAYDPSVQDNLAQAEYWHDPWKIDEYLEKCIFLPDINNEFTTKNQTYKRNLISLNSFGLVQFLNDSVVQPRESEWFGFYKEGQDKIVLPVQNTALYTEDWIGLKTLMDNKKVQFIATEGDHLDFTDEWFVANLLPYLNNTI